MSENPNEPTIEDEDLILTHDELEDLSDADPNPPSVSYAGQDFDVLGLVRRLDAGDIAVPRFGLSDPSIESAGFQRGFVWTKKQMDRFVESLILGFPVPGIFLVRQKSDHRYLVLDGQQRLLTLQYFYRGIYSTREFSLQNVSDRLKGKTYASLDDRDRRTIDNSFMQATVVTTDGSKESLESVYQIFERLNAGGTQLTPHEIRVALYAGPLVDLIEELNVRPSWRSLYGRKSPRLRDQELVLRILAMYLKSDEYARPLKAFLNDFAEEFRQAAAPALVSAKGLFEQASDLLDQTVGEDALRKNSRQVNAARTEAIFFGLMSRLASGSLPREDVAVALNALDGVREFDEATSRSTADENVVSARLTASLTAFQGV